jgi:hypothetical protein
VNADAYVTIYKDVSLETSAAVGLRREPRIAVNICDTFESFSAKQRTRRWNHQTSALLPCFLTLDAVTRPWNRFQPFRFYVTAAFGALAEISVLYPLCSLAEGFEHLPGCIALVNYRLSFVLSGSLISRIGMSCGACSCLLLRSGEHTVQLRHTGFEKLLEVLGFLS